jgi:PAS domain S-box-containing protein
VSTVDPSLLHLADAPTSPLARALRLARRTLGASVAAWVPAEPGSPPVVAGELDARTARAIASRVAGAGTGVTVTDLSRVDALADLKDRFAFLSAVPVEAPFASRGGVLMILGPHGGERPRDADILLVDLAHVAAAAAEPHPAGGDGASLAPELRPSSPTAPDPSEELERLFTAAPDAILFVDAQRILRRVNRAACLLLGYSQEEMVGMPTSELYADPSDYRLQGRLRFNASAVENLEPFQVHWRRKNGSTFIAEVVGAPIHAADGTLHGFVGIGRDVTEQVHAAAALNATTEQLRTIVDNLPLILYGVASDGTITLSEGQGLQRLTRDARPLVGANIFDVYEDQERFTRSVRRALSGEPVRFRITFEGATFENRIVPLMTPDGSVRQVLGIAIDVSEQAATEEALRDATRLADAARREAEANRSRAEEARADAEEAAQAQSHFLASMSHEIRTPLTGIIGFADLLAEIADEESREYAQLIQRSGHRLLDTLNSVLNLARLEAEQVRPSFRMADVSAEVGDAARLLKPLAEARSLRMEILGDPVHCLTDPHLLHRIVTNLVGNAIKFTDEGSVRVTVAREGEGALIQVADTGRGMDPEFLPHLFQPFRREDDDHEQPSGTGLGLAITKRLIDLIGAGVTVETEPGEGSVFSLRIPGAPAGNDAPAAPPAWTPFDDHDAVAMVTGLD